MPMWEVGKIAKDGRPYIDLDQATYIVGLIGLNECVQALTGKELHDDDETYKLGLKIISHMFLRAKEEEKKKNKSNTFPPTKVGGFSATKPVLPDLGK